MKLPRAQPGRIFVSLQQAAGYSGEGESDGIRREK